MAPLIFQDKVKINSTAFANKVRDIAADLGMEPDWLMVIMDFETGGSFSPSVRNPYSTAVGLIQFLENTAAELGTTTTQLAQMTNVQQLDYVKKYFQHRISEQGTIDDVVQAYLAVFYPAAMKKPMSYAFPTKVAAVNGVFDRNKDGQITKQEIYDTIMARIPAGYVATVSKKKMS